MGSFFVYGCFVIVALFNVLIYFVLSANAAGYLRLITMII